MAEPEAIAGARLRRIDLPEPGLLALTLAAPELRVCLVISYAGKKRGVGLLDRRPPGPGTAPPATVMKLRREIENAVVVSVRAGPGLVRLDLKRGDLDRAVIAELGGASGNVVLLAGDRVLAALDAKRLRDRGLKVGDVYAPPGEIALEPASIDALRRAGPSLATAASGGALDRARIELARAIRRAAKRVERKVEAIASDMARAGAAPALRRDARILLSAAHRIGKDDLEVTDTDWEADPPAPHTVILDRALGPRAQADRLFHKARRLERGAGIAAGRHARASVELTRLRALLLRAERAADDPAIAEVAEDARQAGIRVATEAPRSRRGPGDRLPYRRFAASGGRAILVGRGAADNDALTLHHARPHDLFLHARGRRGAHVVVPLQKGESCPPDLLVDAATLAAHFSEAAGETLVEVQHTARRFVRKPRGAAPGAVLLDREKVMLLRLELARLERLLAAEER